MARHSQKPMLYRFVPPRKRGRQHSADRCQLSPKGAKLVIFGKRAFKHPALNHNAMCYIWTAKQENSHHAHIQEWLVRAFRAERAAGRFGPSRCRAAGRKRAGGRRPWRRRHQAARGACRSGEIGRLSHLDPVPVWRPRDIRFRFRQERTGEHIEGGLGAVARCSGRSVGMERRGTGQAGSVGNAGGD